MKISTQWLERLLHTTFSTDQLADIFTSIGLEVEDIAYIGLQKQKTLVIGEIQKIEPHPHADKLSVCQVCVGENDVRQIVCGAKNFKLYDHVPVALPGTSLPGDITIASGNLRGITSEGMMCSSRELGLDNDHHGLMILDASTPVGACFHDIITVPSDVIFDLSLTANRGDCMSHIGVARDVAAKLNLPFVLPSVPSLPSSSSTNFQPNIIVDTPFCTTYMAVRLSAKLSETPAFVARDLQAVGQHLVHPIVDIGNWIMLETGQPIHMFDAQKLQGNRMTIRQARDGETMVGLDDKTYTLTPEDIVICDDRGPVVLAGIMGSKAIAIDENTTDIIIEGACFDSDHVRKSSRRLSVTTESAQRFSRGIDEGKVLYATEYAAHLVDETSSPSVNIIKHAHFAPTTIHFHPEKIASLCGVTIPADICQKILSCLDFKIKILEDHWEVTVPSHRHDITCDADIVSECLRIYGTDHIPSITAQVQSNHQSQDRIYAFQQHVRHYLSHHHFLECCHLSLLNRKETETFTGVGSVLPIRNPLTCDQDGFRNSLLFGLLNTLHFNICNKNTDRCFFETGHVVCEVNKKFCECIAVTFVATESPIERSWEPATVFDFFKMKALTLPIIKNFASRLPAFEPITSSLIWQPGFGGQCGHLHRERFQVTGGMIHPKLSQAYGIKDKLWAFEIIVHPSVFNRKPEACHWRPFGTFPGITKDISLIVPTEESSAKVENTIKKILKKHQPKNLELHALRLFDVYEGDGIPEGHKNLGISLEFRSPERTLTDEEIQSLFQHLVDDISLIYSVRRLS